MNKLFKSSNTLLSMLNTGYYVCKRGDLVKTAPKDTYDIYIMPEGGGLDYFFSVWAKPSMKKSVMFNGKKYTDADVLVNDAVECNKSLTFPSRCYDPMCMAWANEERKIAWYLSKKLGMEIASDVGYVIKDATGKEVLHVNFEMDYLKRLSDEERKDSTSGVLFRSWWNDGWLLMKFKNAEDAVSQLNSLIATQLITDINSDFDILSKLDGQFSSLKDADIESISSIFNGQKIKYREKVLPILKQLIEKFESD